MEKIRITPNNIHQWPKYEVLLKEGKVKFDKDEKLRYLHGAPVGDLVLVANETYKESAEEWFDLESQKAKEFIWPN